MRYRRSYRRSSRRSFRRIPRKGKRIRRYVASRGGIRL